MASITHNTFFSEIELKFLNLNALLTIKRLAAFFKSITII